MVGIVVVGHSRALASAAVALAAEMAPGASIVVAAGLDETTFGTDAVAISEALATADDGDGVVVLMDLGSALMSAELALEFIDDALRERVLLCPAPLVEGLLAAAVTAAGGGSRDEVAAEAMAALAAKIAHFRGESGIASPGGEAGGTDRAGPGDAVVTLTVDDPDGLHARPAARLVSLVRGFDAQVGLRNSTTGSSWVSAASLTRVATLAALHGHELEARATGPQSAAALEALTTFTFLLPAAPGSAEPVTGRSAPAGIGGVGIGRVWRARAAAVEIPERAPRGPEAEDGFLAGAIGEVRQELEGLRSAEGARGEVFAAHLLLLDDEALVGAARAAVAGGESAPMAWRAAVEQVAGEFEVLPDAYLRGRAADVRAVGDQVLRVMLGVPAATLDGEGVLVAEDLTPAEAAGLDPRRVSGVLLAAGSPTAHSAIVLRTQAIPGVVGLGSGILQVAEGTLVAFDGGTGEVVVDPPGDVLAAFRAKAATQADRRAEAARHAAQPAVTRDGIRIAVGANIGTLPPVKAGGGGVGDADLAGLVRTEFLFVDRDGAPGVGDQVTAYREIAAAIGGRPITLRTIDVGGDKPLRYLPQAHEENPFLGVRGLRYSLAHPELFAKQLLAIALTARDTPVNVMFPMVASLSELLAARALLDVALEEAGRPELRVGIMAEVPGAILKAATFAPYVDFVSIGTNDLTQYTLAAERGNPALAVLSDALDPAVLRLIALACEAFGDHVSVCGELAADEAAVPLLIALGVRELSVAPPAIATVKAAVRATAVDRALAAKALTLPDAAAVRALLRADGETTGRVTKKRTKVARELRYGHDPIPQTWPDRENLTEDKDDDPQ